MNGELAALLLVFVIHVVGAGVLIGALFQADADGTWRSWWPTDEDDGGGGGGGRRPEAPRPSGGPPLEDAEPSSVRLRGPGRLGDAYPRRVRRGVPERAPAPVPSRAPATPSR